MHNNYKFPFIVHIFVIVSLCVAYYVNSIYFSYMDFNFDASYTRIFIGFLLLIIILLISFVLYPGFVWAIWHILLILIYYPAIIYYIFNPIAPIGLVLPKTLFFLIIAIFSRLIIKIKPFKFRFENMGRIMPFALFIICVLLFLPFRNSIKHIDITNLLLQNIYETRTLFRTLDGSKLAGYLFMPLSRVLLPVVIVLSVERKNIFLFAGAIILLLFLFLFGALKSIFFGLVMVLLFYRGNIMSKVNIVTFGTILISWLSILEHYLLNSCMLIDIFIRRLFFVPPRIEIYYISFFNKNNYTYWSHNKLGQLFSEYMLDEELSFFVGNKLIGIKGLNANIGFIIEGLVSFGYIGVIVHSVIIGFILAFIQSLKVNNRYFGLFIIMIYLFNTSFLTTLLATHGLLFLIVFSYLFLRETGHRHFKSAY
jgi:hypothetical protein